MQRWCGKIELKVKPQSSIFRSVRVNRKGLSKSDIFTKTSVGPNIQHKTTTSLFMMTNFLLHHFENLTADMSSL